RNDPIITYFSQAKSRKGCVLEALGNIYPDASIEDAFRILRSHGYTDSIPSDSLTANTICMHAGFGPVRINQTTGSMVIEMTGDTVTIWITGTSSPCLSVFQPVRFEEFIDDTVISSEDDWRANEIFHRQALFCLPSFIHSFEDERDKLEDDFVNQIRLNELQTAADHAAIIQKIKNQKDEFLTIWKSKAANAQKQKRIFFYHKAWQQFNRLGKFNLPNT
ncbi:MAG TPA: hypothetical protein VF338_02300, partial [Leptolinea sp.]